MEPRKVAYIVALILVELLAPSDATAGGTSEYVTPSSSVRSVTIPQDEYRELVEAKVRLQLYEEGQTEYAMTITGANQKLEEAYAELDQLKSENSQLKNLPKKEPQLHERLTFGGGVAVDTESNIGGFGIIDLQISDRVGVFGEVIYTDSFAGALGFRFSPWR
ncbi:MAG: hypothetical protein IJ831_03445 [Spirochaetales bacterium]|nr:hypothetical protein [Spirochaetales bacterium]